MIMPSIVQAILNVIAEVWLGKVHPQSEESDLSRSRSRKFTQ
jgi:hypothetical protein